MDEKKMLNEEELGRVAGGTGEGTALSDKELQAFQTALNKFMTVKNKSGSAQLNANQSADGFGAIGLAVAFGSALEMCCRRAINGTVSLDTALTGMDTVAAQWMEFGVSAGDADSAKQVLSELRSSLGR